MPDDQGSLPLLHLSPGRDAVVRSVLTVTATVVIGSLIYAAIPMRGELGYVGAVVAIGAQLTLIPLTIRRARAIQSSPKPVATAIEAIVFLLMILIFGFASAYVVLADHEGQMAGLETKLDAVYFAITTLATVGYGDIHAEGQLARVAVSIQMLFDLVFIAVIVRLIATIARNRVTGGGGDADPMA